MIQTNPVLNIAGYHIFEIEDGDGKTASLICKRAYVRTGSEIDAVSIGDYVLLEKKNASARSASEPRPSAGK
jgi:hypothetical protein